MFRLFWCDEFVTRVENHFAAVRYEPQSEGTLAAIRGRRHGIDPPRFTAFPIFCGGSGDFHCKSSAGLVNGVARDTMANFPSSFLKEYGDTFVA